MNEFQLQDNNSNRFRRTKNISTAIDRWDRRYRQF